MHRCTWVHKETKGQNYARLRSFIGRLHCQSLKKISHLSDASVPAVGNLLHVSALSESIIERF
jgi:hypothetical protein